MSDDEPPARPSAETQRAPDGNMSKWIGLGVGAGIGSAALAAALLYASRATRRKEPRG